MLLKDIEAEWEKDAIVQEDELDKESLKIPQLHSKYYKMFSEERLRLHKLHAEMKVLRLEKQTFLVEGPTEEQHSRGWKLPARGKIYKPDVQPYLEADADIQALAGKIAYQMEKVNLLESIIDSLNRRSYNIGNAIQFIRWQQGG